MRIIGITFMAASLIAGAFLALTGRAMQAVERVFVIKGVAHFAEVDRMTVNWLLVAPVLGCFTAGALCLIALRKTPV